MWQKPQKAQRNSEQNFLDRNLPDQGSERHTPCL